MAGPRPGSFPLLVRGDWGTAEPPAALRKKLLLYFQSPKRSGGGECELRWEAGRLLVCFAQPDVSRRVLDRPAHELEWGPRGKLSLLVTALPEEEDSRSPQEPPAEPEAPADEPVPSVPTPAEQDAVPHPQPPAAGTGLSPQRPPPQEAPPEVHELGAQEASQWEHPSAERTELVVKPGEMETAPEPCQVENPEVSLPSPLMVLENVRENVSSYMLTMLVENISDLSEEDGNFSVEMIPELRAAVVTFTGNAATADIVKKLNQSERAKKQNLTAHLLELTNCIRAENIPPNTPSDYISIYFENKKNGGAQVANVFQQHEEGAAIIKFKDHRDVNNVLSKQHSLNGTPISVYPYYASLGTALYGKEGPQIKQPDPVTVPLDPYIWRFLQRKNSLIEAIRSDMANCNCEITWPRGNCAEPKVILHPSAALSERKRSVAQLVRTWNTVASTTFSYSISKYRVEKLKVSAEVWKAIRTSINHSELLMIPFTSKDLLLVVGHKDILKTVVRELNLLIEKVTREIEREKQTTEEIVMLSPGDFAILQSIGLEERIRLEFPALQITYDHFQQIINLYGLREEVYKVKGEILVNMQKMTKKSVTLHPFVFQFLQRIDNETLSQSLFLSKHISAFYELGPDAVLLKGNDDENLLKAEEELKKELDYKSIALEDESILQKEEWTALTEENCCNAAVTVIQKEGEIIVAGFSQAVAKAFEELFNFVDENTQVQKVIGGKPTVVLMYIKEEKTSVLDDLKNKGVKIDFNKVISLRGPRREVLKGTTLIEQMLSGLHYKRVVINEPGARSYLKERVRFFADSVKNEFNCLIRLEEQPEEYPEEQREHSNVGKCYTQMTVHGVLIAVYKADLCTHHVDVVVNASNEDLKHIGGLAWALLQAAGPELQAECDGVVRMSGSLQAGDAVITGAGKLPCKQVIHAVGPQWKEKNSGKCMYLLMEAIKKSLQLAETYNHRSIAFPSVSGGIFGFPPHKCVNAIVSAIKKTLEEFKRDSSLKEIHLVAVDEETVRVLRETVQKEFTAKSSSSVLQQQCSPNHRQGESQREKRGDDLSMATGGENMITTAEGLRIQVEKKDIIDATTDVIVNSVGTDLKFGVGPLCRALLKEAGPELQMEFDKEKGQQVAGNGSVVCTKGYTLDCTFVFHAVLPQWDRGSGQALKTLENTVHKCLMKAEEFGLKSIAFPAIGTGGFSFPHTVVSKLMFDEVFKFSRCQSRKTLQEVHFVLHPNDRQNIQAFTSELKCRVTGKYCGAAPQPDFISPVSIEASGAYTMRIGSVTLKVTSGDITKEDTEVIVNIANQTFDATSGVFKAIMDAAGFDVKEECNQYGGLLQSGFITTKGGALLCRRIIHLIHSMNVKNQVSEVLHECQLRTYKSVAFPAIGTGAAQQSPAKVADDMLDAIVEFVSSRSVPHLKEIRIIIFQKHMLRDFLQSMKKREDPGLFEPPQSRMSTPKSCFWGPKKSIEKKKLLALEKKVDTVTFQICGESQKNVDATESWIIDVILKEQLENRIVDDVIENFDERQTEALADLQRGKHVTIKLEKNHSPPCITISGINRDVCSVFVEVQKMIQKKKAAQEEQSKAELIYKLVGWKYQKSDDSFVAFDKLTNMQLEDARLCKKPHLTVKINKTIYKVDLNTLQAHDDQGRTINIQREPKNGDMQSIENPAKWEAMQGEQVKLVTLARSCQEYLEVQKLFQKTAHNFVIEQIQRIQNPFLWQSYQIKKKSLCMKNKNQDNEKLLFHGTAKSSLSTINYNGFNRGFAGMHAASIGKGTYFAVDAIYSAEDTYSRPDMSGRKYMYLVRVLTGEFCVGSRELVAAPPKHSADPTDLYDSVVDDVNAPNMFVIFNDIQAYPEYLITFRR